MTPTPMMEDCLVVCKDLQSAFFFFFSFAGLIGADQTEIGATGACSTFNLLFVCPKSRTS